MTRGLSNPYIPPMLKGNEWQNAIIVFKKNNNKSIWIKKEGKDAQPIYIKDHQTKQIINTTKSRPTCIDVFKEGMAIIACLISSGFWLKHGTII